MMVLARLVLLGTGASFTAGRRRQPAILVDCGDSVLLVDAGGEVVNWVEQAGYGVEEIEHVLVTHTHPDHVCGLPSFLIELRARGLLHKRVHVYAPSEDAASLDSIILGLVRSRQPPFEVRPVSPGETLKLSRDVVVEALSADHSVPALSYLIRLRDVSLLISGDTSPTEIFRKRAGSATIALHEASLSDSEAELASRVKHATVSQAVEQVRAAELGVLYHIGISADNQLRRMRVPKEVVVPGDMTSISLH